MGRPRKTDRHDDTDSDFDYETRETGAESEREDDNPMFADAAESGLFIPQSEWPDGLALRWISIEVTGAPDNKNWSVKTSSGKWTPVARGKYPQIDKRFPFTPMPGGAQESGGAIVFGGLCLCERDIRYNIRDRKQQHKATQDAGKTIETYVEGQNANFPRFNQSGPTEFQRGRAQFKE